MDLHALGLQLGATDDEIKNAYKQLVVLHHPDKGGNIDKFKSIQKAYENLTFKNSEFNELWKDYKIHEKELKVLNEYKENEYIVGEEVTFHLTNEVSRKILYRKLF